MRRLSGLDAAFLSIETPVNHMHVLGVAVVDPLTAPKGFTYRSVRELLEGRLHLLPPFRRRLVEVPLGLQNPVWIEDPGFDLRDHLTAVTLPAPGGQEQLAELVARVAAGPLDRSRPLWEMWVVDGLEHGYKALIAKVHHAAIDGVSGVELMSALFDVEAAPGAPRAGAPEWKPERVPTTQELVGHAIVSIARQPMRTARAVRHMTGSLLRVVTRVRRDDVELTAPLSAPRLAMNAAITGERRIAFASVPLADVKFVKQAFGVKVNDVVLAVVAGAMRGYLERRGELPDRSLVAVVPTSERTDSDRDAIGNRVSALFTTLPVELADPVERLTATCVAASAAKLVHEDMGSDTLEEWAELAAPAVFDPAVRAYSRLKLADRHRPIYNLIVSNVPGPPLPLYLAGARLVSFHPMGPIFDGAGLNVTVLSYLDHVDFGFLACAGLVPDLDDLAARLPDALAELVKAAEALAG